MCSATGIPPPEITWMRNGVLLDDNLDPQISLSPSDPELVSTTSGNIYSVNRNLTISNTRDNDSDAYTCVVSNGNARTPNVTQEFELVVQGMLQLYSLLIEYFCCVISLFTFYMQLHLKSLTPQTTSQLLKLKMQLSPAWLLADPGQQLHGSDYQILLYYNHHQKISVLWNRRLETGRGGAT